MDNKKPKIDPVTGKKVKKEKPFWELWFANEDILFIEEDKQREVLLNPGRDYTWFKKTYPVRGEVEFTKKVYIDDLPKRLRGKITAVTAVPRFKEKFEKVKDKVPYKELSKMGLLKAKPLGTYYELFEGEGYSVWTNPTEYEPIGGNSSKRKDKRVSEDFTRNNIKFGEIEGFAKRFGLTDSNSSKDNTTTGTKRKS